MSKTDPDSLQDHTLISAFNKVLILAQPLPLLACVCLHPFAPHYVLFCSVLHCNFAFLYAFLQFMLHHAPRFSHHLHHTPYTIHHTPNYIRQTQLAPPWPPGSTPDTRVCSKLVPWCHQHHQHLVLVATPTPGPWCPITLWCSALTSIDFLYGSNHANPVDCRLFFIKIQ